VARRPAALKQGELGSAAVDTSVGERPLHHLVGVGALAEAAQLGLELGVEGPNARLPLRRQPEPFQRLEPADAHRLARGITLVRARHHEDVVLGVPEEAAELALVAAVVALRYGTDGSHDTGPFVVPVEANPPPVCAYRGGLEA
jgi:hypothetical protein